MLYDRYLAALLKDIRTHYPNRHGKQLTTLFVGGGTPTVLKSEQLSEIIAVCKEIYGFSSGAEISIEANPGTVDLPKLRCLRSAGFNRLSLGVQSFRDDDLIALGRIHCAADGERAFRDAREAGFDNISLDFMYGLPGQTAQDWQENLKQALGLRPQHFSLYQLTIEEETRFATLFDQGRLSLPGEESILEMDEITTRLLEEGGFGQYEISNYARPGFEGRHNLVYWHNDEYLAGGAGAVDYSRGVRSSFIADPELYCTRVEQDEPVIDKSEKLTREASFRESVVMGLRLVAGVSEKRLFGRFGLSFPEVYGAILPKLIKNDLLEYDNMYLRLTLRGRRLANMVMAELV